MQQPTLEQEENWAIHRDECYQRWRSERMQKGLKFLRAAPDTRNRAHRLSLVTKKYGERFAQDLQHLWRSEEKRKHADQT